VAAVTPAGIAVAPNYASVAGRLYSVAAVSASNAWAVGLQPAGALIMHWNGRQWSQYLTPPGYLIGVAARTWNDVWAVGGTNWFDGSQPLIMHFGGLHWHQIPVPSPAGGGYLNAVTATSATNAWAVGLVGPGPGVPSPTTPLIEHWDGKHWAIQRFQPVPGGGQFLAVAVLSATNAWAIGQTGPSSEGTGQQTLIEHWNGASWTRVASPNLPGASNSSLRGVTAIAASNAWAVGTADMPDGTFRTLTAFWNGRHWRFVNSPTPGGDATLLAVTASWTHNIWAVGYTNPSRCGNGGPQCETLIMHWNSLRGKWTALATPNPPSEYLHVVWSVAAITRDNLWAVGTTDYASTLILHWNGHAWS
jgi:hypothetical protein